MRSVNSFLSISGCSDLSIGLPDYRNLLYAAIASCLIMPPFIFFSCALFLCTWAEMICLQPGFTVAISASRCKMMWFITYVWINKEEVKLKLNWIWNEGQDSTKKYPPGVYHSPQYSLVVGKPFLFSIFESLDPSLSDLSWFVPWIIMWCWWFFLMLLWTNEYWWYKAQSILMS